MPCWWDGEIMDPEPIDLAICRFILSVGEAVEQSSSSSSSKSSSTLILCPNAEVGLDPPMPTPCTTLFDLAPKAFIPLNGKRSSMWTV